MGRGVDSGRGSVQCEAAVSGSSYEVLMMIPMAVNEAEPKMLMEGIMNKVRQAAL